MEPNQSTIGYYVKMAVGYTLVCAGGAGIFGYGYQKANALEDALKLANAKISYLDKECKKLEADSGSRYVGSVDGKTRSDELQKKIDEVKSGLENKIDAARDELTRKNHETDEKLDFQTHKDVEYLTSHISFETKYFLGPSWHLRDETKSPKDDEIFPDKKEYDKLSEDQIKKRRDEFAKENAEAHLTVPR